MSHWRREAFDRLPECRKQLQREKTPNLFFHELGEALYQAHVRHDDDLARRIYLYAQWCLDAPTSQTGSDDLPTAITLSFFEHLPARREIRQAIGRFLPESAITGMREVFLYHGTEEHYREMLASCRIARAQ